MGGVQPWQLALGTLVSVLTAILVYRGARITADRSKEGSLRSSEVDEQQSALTAWKDLLEPYQTEVRQLRTDLTTERQARQEQERRDIEDRANAKAQVDGQIAELNRRITSLTSQVAEWKRLARTIARWATTMRDEILRLNGTVPATPDELLTLRAIEESEDFK